MKAIIAVLAITTTALALDQDEFQQAVAASNYKAVSIYPASAQKGTALNQRIGENVARLKTVNPQYFNSPDWPYQITLKSVDELLEREWGASYCQQVQRDFDQVVDIYRDATVRGFTKRHQLRLDALFSQIKLIPSMAKEGGRQMRGDDWEAFAEHLNRITNSYNKRFETVLAALVKAEERRAELADAQYRQLLEDYARAPKQYNGRPLPPNWIDPQQADFNFFMQGLINSINGLRR